MALWTPPSGDTGALVSPSPPSTLWTPPSTDPTVTTPKVEKALDAWGEFKKGFGDFHPEDSYMTAVGQGIRDFVNHGKSLAQLSSEGATFKPLPNTPQALPIKDALTLLGKAAVNHPMETLGQLANTLRNDPELLALPSFGVEGALTEMVVKMGLTGVKVEKALPIINHLVGTTAETGAVATSLEGTKQTQVAGGSVTNAVRGGEQWAALAGITGSLGMFLRKVTEGKTTPITPEEGKKIFDAYTEETGNPEGHTEKDIQDILKSSFTTSTPSGETLQSPRGGMSDAEVNAHRQALEMVNRGASKKEVEAASKRNPLVGKMVDDIMGNRHAFTNEGDLARGVLQGTVEQGALPGEPLPFNQPPPPVPSKPLIGQPSPRAPIPDTPFQGDKENPNFFNDERGAVDKKTALIAGGIAAGALIGMNLSDDKLEGALRGGAVAAGAIFLRNLKDAGAQPEGVRLTEQSLGQTVNEIGARQRVVENNYSRLKAAVPESKDLEAISLAIDSGKVHLLPPHLMGVAKDLSAALKEIGVRAKDEGVIKGLLENYITHIVEKGETVPQSLMEHILSATTSGKGNTTAGSRFGKERTHIDFATLQKAIADSGLRLKTLNAAELYKTYAHAMERAIGYRKWVNNLESEGLVRPAVYSGKFPKGFSSMKIPGMGDRLVSDEIVPILHSTFAQASPSAMLRGAFNTTQAVKRFNVMGSFMHTKSLIEASILSMGILKGLKETALIPVDKLMGTKLSAYTKAIDMFRNGGLGDRVDALMKDGLVLQIPEDIERGALAHIGHATDAVAEQHLGIKMNTEVLGDVLDKKALGVFDRVTWDFIYPAMKLGTSMALEDKMVMDHPEMTPEVRRAEVAKFMNSASGGQNRVELASGVVNTKLRELAWSLTSPTSKMWQQIAMFAPDWTISAARSTLLTLGKGSGVKGLLKPANATDLARLYVLRTALTYGLAINALQMYMTGKPLTDYPDPTRLHLPDGTTIQPFKHSTEAVHWVESPGKELKNKLGFLPKTTMTIMEPKLTTQQKLQEIGGSVLPFGLNTSSGVPEDQKVSRFLYSTLGVPKYGVPRSPAAVHMEEMKKEMGNKDLKDIQKELRKKYKEQQ